MTSTLFNDGWSARPKISGFVDLLGGIEASPVTLPHDAMIGFERDSVTGEGPSTAFFPGGVVEYQKSFIAPDLWAQRRVTLEFDGVHRDAMVYVNDEYAGQWKNGYSTFRIPLDAHLHYGEENVVRVEARAHRDSRWYTGLGIYRDVRMVVTPLAHIVEHEVRITTPDVDDELALVSVTIPLLNDGPTTRRLNVDLHIRDQGGALLVSARSTASVAPGEETRLVQRIFLREPRRWSVDTPTLYHLTAELSDQGSEKQDQTVRIPFGVRTLRIDPIHGLRINDETVLLRGACIHHDNGPLGAATIQRAEERRIELLKAAGFNAIRSSHNPLSPAMLDACDRLGMLVFDEAFDAWTEMNKPFDYTLDFPEWWERDIDAMVTKDFNHPSVILYGIGNEIHEYGSPTGGAFARQIAARIRTQDATRFTSTSVSGFWAVARDVIGDLKETMDTLAARGVNDVMNEMTAFFDDVTTSEAVTVKTAEAHAAVDVAGLNYAEQRYASDAERFPQRVTLGTETNPRETATSWLRTLAEPSVIGGFTWTGWDYLGEVGLGRTDYSDDPEATGGGDPGFPWLTAWAGDLDITGHRRPASYFREIIYGLRTEPYIAVRRPQHHGQRRLEMQWAWSDAVDSWTWDVPEGSPVEIEVYSGSDEVELYIGDKSLGRKPTGPSANFTAHFDAHYTPGTVRAVAHTGPIEVGRTELSTAEDSTLVLSADRTTVRADTTDLSFVAIEFRDGSGVLDASREVTVNVSITGAGILQALGSGRPSTMDGFLEPRCTTFDGRALAIVRPTHSGSIQVIATADGFEAQTVEITAK
ncbi:MAG: glycoside hydrolase family 2 sugar binding [Frondihabitans sp.]|nr:glycoside hydrolase family 2 sugar binding [Frondihabitans sp.]